MVIIPATGGLHLETISMTHVTQILNAIEQGDPKAAEQLLPLVYEELRKLAAVKLAQEKPGQTLEATALVHEAYLSEAGGGKGQSWDSRGHFFSAAAEAMRRILVEQARRKQALRQGGQHQRREVDLDGLSQPESSDELLAIDDALRTLSLEKPAVARLVELRYFAGLTLEEAASTAGISVRTASRYWAYAKAWLLNEIGAGEAG